MRVSTKLRIGYLFSAFIVIFAGVIIYTSFKQMHTTSINLKRVDTIQQGVFELNILGDEFLMYHEERPKIQWQIKHKALGRLIEEANFHDPKNQSLLMEIIEDLKLIRTVFSDLVSSHSISNNIFESKLLRQKQNRLKSRLLLKSQGVLSNATQLKNQMADELFSIQKYTNWISLTLIIAAVLLSLLIEFLISRSITSPIKDLMQGTEIVSSGNLEFHLDTDRSDEIGRLSRSFDQMINNLKKIMVSRDELERRVEERTAELAASNRQLNSEIEERKQAELDAQRHRAELTHVSRVATLGELSASLAHELNQPLTAILSNAQAARRFLAGDQADPEEVNEILDDIINDDKRAADIIKRLRALMRRKELAFTSLDLNKIVREVAELVNREAFTKNVSLVLDLTDGLPHVQGDAIHLQQVALNLIINGTEAMETVDHQSRELGILTAKHDENAVCVSVRDQGTGIDEDHIGGIFEAFYTTKPEGMGMGLSICRSIIEAHGGRLWAENNPDRGATISFTVPISK